MMVDLEMELVSVEIRTNSILGSKELLALDLRNAQNEPAGGYRVEFATKPLFQLLYCTHGLVFPMNLPTATDKIWRMTLHRGEGIRVLVHCNRELVLNVKLSDQVCNIPNWRNSWSTSVTGIIFPAFDTASNYYKIDQGN